MSGRAACARAAGEGAVFSAQDARARQSVTPIRTRTRARTSRGAPPIPGSSLVLSPALRCCPPIRTLESRPRGMSSCKHAHAHPARGSADCKDESPLICARLVRRTQHMPSCASDVRLSSRRCGVGLLASRLSPPPRAGAHNARPNATPEPRARARSHAARVAQVRPKDRAPGSAGPSAPSLELSTHGAGRERRRPTSARRRNGRVRAPAEGCAPSHVRGARGLLGDPPPWISCAFAMGGRWSLSLSLPRLWEHGDDCTRTARAGRAPLRTGTVPTQLDVRGPAGLRVCGR